MGPDQESRRDDDAPQPLVRKVAFVDAYGDPGLDVAKEAATSFFIIAAVLVDASRVPAVREEANALRRKHFGEGPIKSARCGEDERRLKVLRELVNLDFKFVAVAIDKSRVWPESGLRFHGSFVKYTHSKLLDRLYRRHPDLEVVCDRAGNPQYMASFGDYVLAARTYDLFSRPTFRFELSRNDPLIQVADFVAGSLARIYDAKKFSGRAKEIHELLFPRSLWVEEFPARFGKSPPPARLGSNHDRTIRSHALQMAHAFVNEHAGSDDPDTEARVETVQYLLYWFADQGEDKYMPTDRLTEHLADLNLPRSKRQIRMKIIAPLRDADVLIASSSVGYKLPSCVADLRETLQRLDSMVVPMLNRAENIRNIVKELSVGDVDLLDGPGVLGLREAIEGRAVAEPDLHRVPRKNAG